MPEQTPPVAYRHPLRVYWEDTDAGGVVFYANYLKFFERARTEWLRALGFSQQQMLQHERRLFVVADTAVRYLRAARLDDQLQQRAADRLRTAVPRRARGRCQFCAEPLRSGPPGVGPGVQEPDAIASLRRPRRAAPDAGAQPPATSARRGRAGASRIIGRADA